MFYIRTDMNNIIATGHVMRCLSIADAIRKLGEDVTFILADDNAVALISDRGYESIVLKSSWNDMDAELPMLKILIHEKKIEKILVDSYQVTENYLQELKRLTKVAYIDDVNMFVYMVDMLICYANYWQNFNYKNRYENTKLLLGLDYAPLRVEFQNAPKKKISDSIENLLIMTGGTDRFNIIENLLKKIDRRCFKIINIICGSYYSDYDKLCQRYEDEKNIIMHKAVKNIEQYMKDADVAITAGGTTLYELCAIGTPSISLSFADNQLDNVLQFERDGIIDYAGDVRKDDVYPQIVKLLETYTLEKRNERSRKMQTLVDGLGAMRIAEELLKF